LKLLDIIFILVFKSSTKTQMNISSEFGTQIKIYFENTHKNVLMALGGFIFLLIACIDYLVSPEISLSFFYLLPVFILTWFVSRKAGFITSILSASAGVITSPSRNSTEISFLVPYWNAVVTLLIFLTVSYILFEWRSVMVKEKESARTDPTTGIANKRLFFELARLELKKVNRYRHPLTVIYIDIDDFKKINDTWGRSVGDNLLQKVAETIKHSIRETDIIARIGGDEFIILLPGSGYEPAKIVIHRVQNELLDSMQKNEWPATFSIGAVTFINPPSSVEAMIQPADHLIYLVKTNGKNQIKHKTSV
jgi:diguanylate cyclase (GGDEF)-like protein